MNAVDIDRVEPTTTYYEKKVGKTLYCVTNVYAGKFELGKLLEEIIIKRVLRDGLPETSETAKVSIEIENKK